MYSTAILSILVAAVAAAPAGPQSLTARQNGYVSYHGDGSVAAGWPDMSQWTSFDSLWSSYNNLMLNSCGFYPGAANTSPTELSQVRDAINAFASSTGVDNRMILATVIQESKGCVRAWETQNGVQNPGLMQSHNGAGTCNASKGQNGVEVSHVTPVDPCPQSEISLMIQDGTQGTSSGPGLQGTLATAGGNSAQSYYKAARIYNSGSIAASGDLSNANGATASYASDIANRLRGVFFDNSNFA